MKGLFLLSNATFIIAKKESKDIVYMYIGKSTCSKSLLWFKKLRNWSTFTLFMNNLHFIQNFACVCFVGPQFMNCPDMEGLLLSREHGCLLRFRVTHFDVGNLFIKMKRNLLFRIRIGILLFYWLNYWHNLVNKCHGKVP